MRECGRTNLKHIMKESEEGSLRFYKLIQEITQYYINTNNPHLTTSHISEENLHRRRIEFFVHDLKKV